MFELAKVQEEINHRNQLRAEVQLPPLSMAQELRKLYNAERRAEFEAFFNTSPLRERIEAKLLARIRRLRGDPEWMPTGFLSGGGFAFNVRTRKVMSRIWRARRRLGQ
jgi:hypothetical protein